MIRGLRVRGEAYEQEWTVSVFADPNDNEILKAQIDTKSHKLTQRQPYTNTNYHNMAQTQTSKHKPIYTLNPQIITQFYNHKNIIH